MQNYFNYFTEIETRFQARRGSILLLSTLDWSLIESWRDAGVPLPAVLRGIDDAFDKYEARRSRARGRLRQVNGLAWCAQSVMLATEAMQEAAVGSTSAAGDTPESGFEAARVAGFLRENAKALQLADLSGDAGQALFGIAHRLEELAKQVEESGGTGLATEEIEATLTALEARMFAALTLHASEESLTAIREQAGRELGPYRGKMSAVQLKQVTEQFLHKRLLQAAALPRLSLFYMGVG